jgi:diguanylate cyclase
MTPYGHVAGDIVLRQLSKMLKQNLRATDVAGRYGGDELRDSSGFALNNAAAVMEALRDRFATLGYEQNPALKVSLSIGLAAFNPGHSDATSWLGDADRHCTRPRRRGVTGSFAAAMVALGMTARFRFDVY